ncbi:hypothetical protein [Acinetobacter indicus]|uniref:hypothetical protein n=1 Tax=Acinetobacter indicus TaxID=756892 RepID=UPI00131580DA|nr:hypothetical protein [Acinetobacter indicus]
MKKLIVGLSSLILSTSLFASTIELDEPEQSLGQLKGRYALDCSKNKAHDLSYVIGDKSIFRLISAKQKHALLKSIEKSNAKSFEGYQYLSTAKYQGFTVDFYQKDNQKWAWVRNTSLTNFYGPKTSKLLMQCKVNNQVSVQ